MIMNYEFRIMNPTISILNFEQQQPQEEQGRNCKCSWCMNRVATAPFEPKPGQNESDGLQEAF